MALRSIQDQLHDSVRSYRELQQEVSQLVTQQVKLQQQVNETKMVEQELAMLDETSDAAAGGENGGVVYKLVGPLLVRQDTYEAKANVAKRLEYIQKEIQRMETALKSLESKQLEKQRDIQRFQQKLQSLQAASTTASAAS